MLGWVAVLSVHSGQGDLPLSEWIGVSRLVAAPSSRPVGDPLLLWLAHRDFAEECTVPQPFG